ncbi:hypothetical protein RclHR1_12720009 [Rhizophagus clarus]|uniref:Uncharacterized protein n=1 Tax=Rhizophagus clarus TaxID=94130 RepID=A0A2Z6QCT5_9GLOM|nr:hypothetical protein RclHR1_12720009 [Rhizophagus clarus]
MMPENKDRWSDICDEHICGWSRTFYSINIGQPTKSLDQQTEWLFQHLEQLAKWILILEADEVEDDIPTTICITWKVK